MARGDDVVMSSIRWRDPGFVFIDLMRLHDIHEYAFNSLVNVLEIKPIVDRSLSDASSYLMNRVDIFRFGADLGFRRSSEIAFVYDEELGSWLESHELTENIDREFPTFPVKCW